MKSSAAPLKAPRVAGASTAMRAVDAPSSSSWSGRGVRTLLLFAALSAPVGAAVFLSQNPDRSPAVLLSDANWNKFLELVTDDSRPKKDAMVPTSTAPKEPSKTPEEELALIAEAEATATLEPKQAAPVPAEETKPTPAIAENKTPDMEKGQADQTRGVNRATSGGNPQRNPETTRLMSALVATRPQEL